MREGVVPVTSLKRRGGGAEAGEGSEVTGGREETGAESTEQVSETGEVSVNSEDCERQESGEQGDNTESSNSFIGWIIAVVVLGGILLIVGVVLGALAFTGRIILNCQKEPTVVRVKEGSDAILPCLLRGENIEGKLFDWRKKDETGVTKEVFMYEGGDHYNNGREGQDEQFRGRVSHFEGEMKNGNASIIIRNPKVHLQSRTLPSLKQRTGHFCSVLFEEFLLNHIFSGRTVMETWFLLKIHRKIATVTKTDTYRCVVTQEEINHQTQAEIYAYINGAASKPSVGTLDQTKDWALLQCEVLGASPKPQLQWQDSDGNLVPAKDPQEEKRGGSYDIILQAAVTKTDTYRCVVTQKEINHQTQAETYVYISESFCTIVVIGCSLGSFFLGAVAVAAVQALIKSPICSTKCRNKATNGSGGRLSCIFLPSKLGIGLDTSHFLFFPSSF
ncbi:hypothetical protein L3Q82_007464 [Scortum barcoo]|uniref:Uncharacterized protein n=1 Tax=Scortum barcoo TaxID=214431 RepID=A0ACB8WNN5_9TELE|nr:hypothetical protein L3Q82_007464 [Scortum barcoo]